MAQNYWKDGVNQIIKKVLNGKRTIQQALFYMDDNFTGDNRRSFNHQAFEATSSDTRNEMEVYNLLKDAIKLGYGKDYNFERVYR
jgi:hypothetical protein